MELKNVEKQEKSIIALTVEISAEEIDRSEKKRHIRKTVRASLYRVSVRARPRAS